MAVVPVPCAPGTLGGLEGAMFGVETVFAAWRGELFSVGGVEFAVRVLGFARLLAVGVACCWREGYVCERVALVLAPNGCVAIDGLAGFVAWVGTVFVAGRGEVCSVGGVAFAFGPPMRVGLLVLGTACCWREGYCCEGLAPVFIDGLVFMLVRCCSCAFSWA